MCGLLISVELVVAARVHFEGLFCIVSLEKKRVIRVVKSLVPVPAFVFARRLYRSIYSLKYRGNKFHCSFCGRTFSEFLPAGYDLPVLKEHDVVGGGRRYNAICPNCYSHDRERLVFLYLKAKKGEVFKDHLRILHVAPELNLGPALKANKHADYVSSDLSSRLAGQKMDITAINEPDDSFHVVICNHVLEHVLEDVKAMRELYRVLKPGGFAILQVPLSFKLSESIEDPNVVSEQERERVFGQKDHVRLYGKDYVTRLREAEFKVTLEEFVKEMDEESIKRHGLNSKEVLFICEKI